LNGHSHWIYNIKFNPLHDELLLSCSADCLVNLWYIPSVSSKANEDNLQVDEGSEPEDEEEEEEKM